MFKLFMYFLILMVCLDIAEGMPSANFISSGAMNGRGDKGPAASTCLKRQMNLNESEKGMLPNEDAEKMENLVCVPLLAA
jgi:hypothetical protein